MYTSFSVFLLSTEYLGMALLGHMKSLCLTFGETTQLFSKVAVAFCIPTNNILGLQFYHILAALAIVGHFITVVLLGGKWYMVFIIIFILNAEIKHAFMCLLVIHHGWCWWWLSRGHPCIYIAYLPVNDYSKVGLKHSELVRFSPFTNDLCSGCRVVLNFRSFSSLLWLFLFIGVYHVLSTWAQSHMDTRQCAQCLDNCVLSRLSCVYMKLF